MSPQREPQNGRTHCQVYSRIVGFYRSTDHWNDAKLTEFEHRRPFSEEKITENLTKETSS